MSNNSYPILESSGKGRPRSNSSYATNGGYLTAPMTRGNSAMSSDSFGTQHTRFSDFDNEQYGSPSTAFSGPNSPGGYMGHDTGRTSYPQFLPQDSEYFPSDGVASEILQNDKYYLGDPRDGNPEIHGSMYYEFFVSKTDAFWRLKEGYGPPSDEFPAQRPDEKMVDKKTGHRIFPCRHPDCAPFKSFNRPWDLRRHFERHVTKDRKRSSKAGSGSKDSGEIMKCDYSVCPSSRHMNPFETRKDHFREHYRDVHREDLVKRNISDPGILKKWFEDRQYNPKWFRCSKCLHKTKISKYGWVCDKCKTACEECRVKERERRFGGHSVTAPRSAASTSGASLIYRGLSENGQSSGGVGTSQLYTGQGFRRSVDVQGDYGSGLRTGGNMYQDAYEDDAEDQYDDLGYNTYSSYPSRLDELPEINTGYDSVPTGWNVSYSTLGTSTPARGEAYSTNNAYPRSNGSEAYSGDGSGFVYGGQTQFMPSYTDQDQDQF